MAPRTKKVAVEGDATEDDVKGGGLIILNSLGTYGMKITKERKQFQVLQRKLYEDRTEIPNPFAKEGEPQVKVYEAGEYGPWVDSPRPFPSGADAPISALKWVALWMMADEASKHDVLDLETAIEYFQLSLDDIKATVKAMGLS